MKSRFHLCKFLNQSLEHTQVFPALRASLLMNFVTIRVVHVFKQEVPPFVGLKPRFHPFPLVLMHGDLVWEVWRLTSHGYRSLCGRVCAYKDGEGASDDGSSCSSLSNSTRANELKISEWCAYTLLVGKTPIYLGCD